MAAGRRMRWPAKDALREKLRVFNPHNLCEQFGGGAGIYLAYRKGESRPFRSAAWPVIGAGFKTDPHAHWTDGGHRTFDVFSFDNGNGTAAAKKAAFAAALAWARETYRVELVEKDPFGAYQAEGTHYRVTESIRAIEEG